MSQPRLLSHVATVSLLTLLTYEFVFSTLVLSVHFKNHPMTSYTHLKSSWLILLLIFRFIYFKYRCSACMCMCTVYMPGARGGQKRELDSMALELQTVVSYHLVSNFSRRAVSALNR